MRQTTPARPTIDLDALLMSSGAAGAVTKYPPVDHENASCRCGRERVPSQAGTTRARIDALMRKFQRLGFITRGNDTQVHPTLVNVVLDD